MRRSTISLRDWSAVLRSNSNRASPHPQTGLRFDREDIARYLLQYGLGLAQPIRPNVSDGDPHAGLEKNARHAASDAAGTAGDKCDFALEFLHSVGRDYSTRSISSISVLAWNR